MSNADSNFVALEIVKLDTDESTKTTLIRLLDLERENLHTSKFMTRPQYRKIISASALKWDRPEA